MKGGRGEGIGPELGPNILCFMKFSKVKCLFNSVLYSLPFKKLKYSW